MHKLTYQNRHPYMVISIRVTGDEILEFSHPDMLKQLIAERGYLVWMRDEVEKIVAWAEQSPGNDHAFFKQEVYLKDARTHSTKVTRPGESARLHWR